MGKFSKTLAVIGLLCLGSVAAKADTLPAPSTISGTTITYTGVTINYDGTNSPSSIWNGGASATETVTFTNIGGQVGIQIGSYPSTVPGNGDVYYNGCTAGTTCLPTSSPFFVNAVVGGGDTGLTISGPTSAPTIASAASGMYNSPLDQVCVLNNADNFNSCNTGSDPAISASYAAGLFTVTDASLGVTFTFSTTPTSTPEPSTLFGLGSGLIGLLGFGLRRKGIA